MSSEENFFSEFYYPDKIVTENEGNVKVLSISRALPIWSHKPKGSVHKAKNSPHNLEFHSKAGANKVNK